MEGGGEGGGVVGKGLVKTESLEVLLDWEVMGRCGMAEALYDGWLGYEDIRLASKPGGGLKWWLLLCLISLSLVLAQDGGI